MPASGMRYKKTLELVEQIKEKQQKMQELLKKLSDERTKEVASQYGGEASQNFQDNTIKIANYMDEEIKKITTKLSDEAETQHDAYLAQEQRLKSQVEIK